MNLHKVTKIAALIIAILSLVFLSLVMANDGDNEGWISVLIYLSYVILLACVAIVLIFVFKNLFSNKETLKRTMITLGLFAGVLLLSYLLADGSDVYNVKKELLASGSVSKLVSTGLTMTYIVGMIAVGSLFFFMFKNAKK